MLRADWRREYRTDLMDDLDAGLSWNDFATYLAGLSSTSRWWRAARKEPIQVTGEAARDALRRLGGGS